MRRLATALALLAALGAVGCGLGAGKTPGDTRLVVTEDFGTRVLLDSSSPEISGEDTVLRMLDRNAEVQTRYGGKFVQSIDGASGGTRGGRSVDWLFYVNGRQADEGAASVELQDGDAIWWDLHPWEVTTAEAVVGQYPEPFLHGPLSKRLPVRVECVDPPGAACRDVQDRLVAEGITASRAQLAAQLERETLRILVGPIARLRGDRAVDAFYDGPAQSGVFARPAGGSIELLDVNGKGDGALRAGGGLIAAIQPKAVDPQEELQPVWLVTGVDEAGVELAASALDEGTLARKFALAITPDGRGIGLPRMR